MASRNDVNTKRQIGPIYARGCRGGVGEEAIIVGGGGVTAK